MATLDLSTSDHGDRVHFSFSGELDLASAHRVEAELQRVEARAPGVLVLDLRDLTFMDSTGLRLIADADRRAREAGRRVVLVQGPETVHRVFEITRLDSRFEMVDDPGPLLSGST